jgi:predicted DNA-binding transcriptional regulator AlpA
MARPEVTGKKTQKAKAPRYRRRPVTADPNSLALSIREFCRLHAISEDQFYKMKREGWGPRTMQVGSRTLISHEASAEWRRDREAAAKEATEKKAAEAAATAA